MSARDLLPAILALALLAALPFLGLSGSVLNFLVTTLIIALAGLGWNVLGGFGGQYSFGHAAFFGTGAYATAILQMKLGWNAWGALGAGIGLGALVGLAIGYLSFRAGLRGSYFALVTLAFAEVFRILANAADFTGGRPACSCPCGRASRPCSLPTASCSTSSSSPSWAWRS